MGSALHVYFRHQVIYIEWCWFLLLYISYIISFYELTVKASKHEITELRRRTIAYVLAIFSIQWIRTSNETPRTAISRTAFWEKPLSNYLFNLLYFHNSVTMFITIKTFHSHLNERRKKYVSKHTDTAVNSRDPHVSITTAVRVLFSSIKREWFKITKNINLLGPILNQVLFTL